MNNKMKKKSILWNWLITSTLFFSAVVIAFFYLIHFPMIESTLHKNLRDRTKTVTTLLLPRLEKSIQDKDDVSTLNLLQELANSPDAIYSRVVDNENNVVYDNRIERWGQKSTDLSLASKLVKMDKPLFFKRTDPDGYDYVVPLTLSDSERPKYLNVGVTTQKIDSELASIKSNSLYIIASAIFTSILFFFITFHLFVLADVKNLQKSLESVLLGSTTERINLEKKNEITSLGVLLNQILDKTLATASGVQESDKIHECLINNFIYELASEIKNGIVVLDSSDNILYINDVALDILKITQELKTLLGKHLIDVFKDTEFLMLLKKSASNIGKPTEEHIKSVSAKARVVTVDNGKNQSGGTIIFLDRRS